jgi:hypothetical protein
MRGNEDVIERDILTNVVAIESGKTAAVIEKAAVNAAEAPRLSTIRTTKLKPIKPKCVVE